MLNIKPLKRVIVVCLLFCCIVPGWAFAQQFVVKSIQVEGLQKITRATVIDYLPIRVGQTFTPKTSTQIITKLYKLGFFSNVSVASNGQILVVKVQERPTIGLLTITGNKAITKKQLEPVLKQVGIEEGKFYDPAKTNQLIEGLQQQYNLLGRHAAKINTTVKTLPGNRVALQITINEGPVTAVKKIEIDGAPQFSQRQMKKNFKLTTSHMFSFITHSDRYSEQQLQQDLRQLQSFFMNHGYLQYRLVSQKVTMTPDHKGVDIKIVVAPGAVFTVGKIHLGPKINKNPALTSLVTIHSGEVFSREKVMKINQDIGNYYADRGYAFPHVNLVPKLNPSNKTVDLSFDLTKGKLTYVRHVRFSGNSTTQDQVLRYQMRQMEGGTFSLKSVNESKRKLALLPYLKNIQVKTVPVDGRDDQVDLDYSVEEVKAGAATLNVGYSDVDGFLYGVSLTEPNFLGSGKMVSLSFQKSDYWSQYNVSYVNPFYTIDGMSRGFNITVAHYTPSDVDLDTYDMDQYGGSVNYSMPVSENIRLSWGGGYKRVDIGSLPDTVSPSVEEFVTDNPSPYDEFNLSSGLSYDGRDRAFFPRSGSRQGINLTLSLPVLDSSLPYYMAKYKGAWYLPVGGGFILNSHTILGYGNGYDSNDQLPFFENLYAGGIDTLPGYEAGGLGPYYTYTEENSDGTTSGPYTSSLGGNLELIGGFDFIFPNPFPDSVRTAITLDAGNVFQTYDLAKDSTPSTVDGTVTQDSIQLKNMRVTAGLMVQWRTFMPLNFSCAFPLNEQSGDLTQVCTMSANSAL